MARHGASAADPWAGPRERPPGKAELAPFLIAKHELTCGQLRRGTGLVRGAVAGSSYRDQRDDDTDSFPVETITPREAEDALAFLGLSLPTEVQWEYAARAGTTTPWWTGPEPASLQGAANVLDRDAHEEGLRPLPVGGPGLELQDGYRFTAPVGRFAPNPFGLHDVHGNVAEIVADTPLTYDVEPRAGDGLREGGHAAQRIFRGGSFADPVLESRSSARRLVDFETRLTSIGVRPACALRQE